MFTPYFVWLYNLTLSGFFFTWPSMLTLGVRELSNRIYFYLFPWYDIIVRLLSFFNKIVKYSVWFANLAVGGTYWQSFRIIPFRLVDLAINFLPNFTEENIYQWSCSYLSLSVIKCHSTCSWTASSVDRSAEIHANVGKNIHLYFDSTQTSSQNFIPNYSSLLGIYILPFVSHSIFPLIVRIVHNFLDFLQVCTMQRIFQWQYSRMAMKCELIPLRSLWLFCFEIKTEETNDIFELFSWHSLKNMSVSKRFPITYLVGISSSHIFLLHTYCNKQRLVHLRIQFMCFFFKLTAIFLVHCFMLRSILSLRIRYFAQIAISSLMFPLAYEVGPWHYEHIIIRIMSYRRRRCDHVPNCPMDNSFFESCLW